MIEQLFMGIVGFSFGMIVSGGVFTVFVAVAMVPRLAGKTHTGGHVLLYENAVCFGTILGSAASIFARNFELGSYILDHQIIEAGIWKWIGSGLLGTYGLFSGIFVGCFALAIAEMLDAIPIFIRRVSLTKGLAVVIAAMAIGKLCGSILYFSQGFFHYGGL